MATAQYKNTEIDFLSSGSTLAKLAATSSTFTFTGASSAKCTLAGIAIPTAQDHVATKAYVDNLSKGLHTKAACQCATTANLAYSYAAGTVGEGATLTATGNGAVSIDGVALQSGFRVLVKDQTTKAQNGIYYVSTAGSASATLVLTRATDLDTSEEITGGEYTFVENGTSNKGDGYVVEGLYTTALTGTISVSKDTTAVTGSGTSFTSELAVGQGIRIGNDAYRVGAIASDTALTIVQVAQSTLNGQTAYYGPVVGTTNIEIAQLSGIGGLTAGSGITLSGDTISVSTGGVTDGMLSGSISNGKLSNSAVTVTAGDGLSGGGSVSLGSSVSLAVQVDDSSIETNSDTIRVKALGVTNAMLAGSIANAKLSNSTISGVALGSDLAAHTLAVGSSSLTLTNSGSTFNGSGAVTHTLDTAQAILTSSTPTFGGMTLDGALNAKNGSTSSGTIVFYENSSNGTHTNTLKCAESIASNVTHTLPTATGTLVGTGDSGTITSGMIAAGTIANDRMASATISGVSLGSNLNAHTIAVGSASLTLTNSGTTFNGSAGVSHSIDTAQNIQTSGAPTFAGLTLNGGLNAKNGNTSAGKVVFYENSDNGTNHVTLKAPESVASNISHTLPSAAGTLVGTGDSGTITSGMIAAGTIANDRMASATISGVSLGSNLGTHTIAIGSASLTLTNSGTTYNGSTGVSHTLDTAQDIRTTASPTFAAMSITGTATANQFTATSDYRLKEDFQDIDDPMATIMSIKPQEYSWNQDKMIDAGLDCYYDSKRHVGLMAQDVEAKYPEMVATDANGYKSLDYSRLTTLLWGAVRQQQSQINELKAQLSL